MAVAPGAAEAAAAHIRLLAARVRLVNTQLKEANRRLDALCQEIASGRGGGAPGDAAILRSLPGVDRVVLATALNEASEPLGRRDTTP